MNFLDVNSPSSVSSGMVSPVLLSPVIHELVSNLPGSVWRKVPGQAGLKELVAAKAGLQCLAARNTAGNTETTPDLLNGLPHLQL